MKINLIKKKNATFIYLVPTTETDAQWEILEQDELERRIEANELDEQGRVFEIAKERTIRTEKTTFLD